MRICHIITRLIVGGAQENTLLTCEGLHDRGHEVTLISGPTSGPEGSLVPRAARSGYRFIECPPLRRRISPVADALALLDLAKLLREIHPDVVHTHSSKAGILGRLAAARCRTPAIVHTIHGMSFNRTQTPPVRAAYRLAERLAARHTHAFISVCDAMTDQALAAGLGRCAQFTTVYSGMDVAQFDPRRYDAAAVRAEWGCGADHVVVGVVARLFRNKGYEDLIPAMALAAARRPELRFVWIGDGVQRAAYEAWLARLNLAPRVMLTGLVEPERIPRLLAGIDLLAHASRWEGLPRAVVQALLMEKPAVCFDIDGAPEVVRHGRTGLLVRAGDRAGLADAIAELAADASRRRAMGQAGRALCLPRFDHQLMVAAIERVYERLFARSCE